jgi:glycosyltransferase involved in cell wall biosynthesis
LEKLCYRNHHTVIFVSKAVKADYEKVIGLKGKYYILYNFIEGDFFSEEVKRFSNKEKLKMVVIGNFREIKNHMYLLEGLLSNTSTQVSLDIFGDGRLKNEYTTLIRDNQLPVMIKGKCVITRELLIEYDIFVMPSHSEGCPTALQEAMAAGLPLMVSDIEVMHEVTGGNAIFINLTDPKDFVNKINSVLEGNIDLPSLAEKSLSYAKRYYTKEKYMERLIDILSEK